MERRPHHHPPPPPPPSGREDCWSEEETGWLIDAWGDRYLHLSRGNLRQKDWSDVANAVNSRLVAHGRPRKTDVQCKNRVDTIKKKYKLEKSKPGPSSWRFFPRLDMLILPDKKTPSRPVPKPRAGSSSLAFTVKTNYGGTPVGVPTPAAAIYSPPVPSESSSDEEEEDEEVRETGKRGRGVDGAFAELANAVLGFADVYEKVESMKHRQMMEMERKRMEFARDLEFQRMQTFMDSQLEMEKMKRPKYNSGSGKRAQ